MFNIEHMTATYKCNGQAIIFRFESIYQQQQQQRQ